MKFYHPRGLEFTNAILNCLEASRNPSPLFCRITNYLNEFWSLSYNKMRVPLGEHDFLNFVYFFEQDISLVSWNTNLTNKMFAFWWSGCFVIGAIKKQSNNRQYWLRMQCHKLALRVRPSNLSKLNQALHSTAEIDITRTDDSQRWPKKIIFYITS